MVRGALSDDGAPDAARLLEQPLRFRERGVAGGDVVLRAQRQDQIAGLGLVAIGAKDARFPKNVLVGGRADDEPRLLHARQGGDLPGDAHQHDGVEIGRRGEPR